MQTLARAIAEDRWRATVMTSGTSTVSQVLVRAAVPGILVDTQESVILYPGYENTSEKTVKSSSSVGNPSLSLEMLKSKPKFDFLKSHRSVGAEHSAQEKKQRSAQGGENVGRVAATCVLVSAPARSKRISRKLLCHHDWMCSRCQLIKLIVKHFTSEILQILCCDLNLN